MSKEEVVYDKHRKYYKDFIPNDMFWGIGIECETYLEVSESPKVLGSFYKNQKRERYSVNYYENYLDSYFNKAVDTLIDSDTYYELPYLVNSHELTRNDLSGNSKTLYDKNCTPNKKYQGKSVFETMCERDSYFREEYEKSYCFDGDTLEFMTQDFYKKNIRDVINELIFLKKHFLQHINKLKLPLAQDKHLIYPKENYGFARFSTNKNNLAIFNNGTYHFNFTLPTVLDDCGNILNIKEFNKKHAKAIKIIQFLEPFFIAKYGSGDVLSKSPKFVKRFPKGSQRMTASRYVGAATYDSDILRTGKILQEERKRYQPLWYNKLYNQIHYSKNDKIGFDINFNKFKNHGIEIRFFDWFPEEHLEEVLTFIVYLLDHSFTLNRVDNPIKNETYNDIMFLALLDGKDAVLTYEQIGYIKKSLKLKVPTKNKNIVAVYDVLFNHFKNKYKFDGECSKYMLEKPPVTCWCF